MSKPKQPLPQRAVNVDITKHDLDTSDGFLWSLIDGVQTLLELRQITGFDEEEIVVRLHRLKRMGVIVWDERGNKPPISLVPPPPALSDRPARQPSAPAPGFEGVPTGGSGSSGESEP